MATYVVTAQQVTINSVDITTLGYVRSASLELTGDQVEFTNMASSGSREFKLGLKSGTLNVEFSEDFANSASATDQLLWGLFNTGSNITFELRATSAAVGVTNPKYTGSVVPVNYSPFTASVGDGATTSISWPTTGAVSRATA
jgi:hypothetical protein